MGFFAWLGSLFKKKDVTGTSSPSSPPKASAPSKSPPASTPSNGAISVPRPADLPSSNHYASRDRKTLTKEYAFLFAQATIMPKWQKEITRSVLWAKQNKAQFLAVQQATNVPWFVVAIINIMEMGTDLDGTLLNGDPWNKKTVHYPSGKGPWRSWLEAAIFAIHDEEEGWNFNLKTYKWDIGGVFYYLEAWNGFNARMEPQYSLTTPKGASPYIYSATPFYVKGKKREMPSRFEPELVSQQIGCMAFLKELENSGERLF